MTPYIPLITKKYTARVAVEDILYLHQKNRQLEVVTVRHTYEYYGRLDSLKPYLDGRFLSVLQSVVVNLEQVERMEDQTIFFQNGQAMALGRCNFIRAKQAYSDWMLESPGASEK